MCRTPTPCASRSSASASSSVAAAGGDRHARARARPRCVSAPACTRNLRSAQGPARCNPFRQLSATHDATAPRRSICTACWRTGARSPADLGHVLLGWEEQERARRSLERRLRTAHIGRFKPLCAVAGRWWKLASQRNRTRTATLARIGRKIPKSTTKNHNHASVAARVRFLWEANFPPPSSSTGDAACRCRCRAGTDAWARARPGLHARWGGRWHRTERRPRRSRPLPDPCAAQQIYRIRYYGFLANCHRERKLAGYRKLLGMARMEPTADPPAEDYRDRFEALTGCPARMSALSHRHHGGNRLHCAANGLPANSQHIMTPNLRSDRAMPNLPRDPQSRTTPQ